eukprot:gene23112-30313_t
MRQSYRNLLDDRAAVGRGRYTPSNDSNFGQPPAAAQPTRMGTGDIPPPPGWPLDLSSPEEIPPIIRRESEPLEDIGGEYCARAFFSKDWQLRDAALNYLSYLLRQRAFQDKQTGFKTLIKTIEDLVPQFGIAKGNGQGGFDLHDLMEYVGKAYSSSNADVRSCAVRVTKAVHDIVGFAIKKTLPTDINPKIRERIEEIVNGGGPRAGPSPSLLPPLYSPTAQSPGVRTPPPILLSPPHASRSRQSQQQYTAQTQQQYTPQAQQQYMPQAQQRGGKASAAMANLAMGQPPYPRTPPHQPAANDPAMFEAEIEAKEAQLGADHPEVAQACSNAAILHGQNGQYKKAGTAQNGQYKKAARPKWSVQEGSEDTTNITSISTTSSFVGTAKWSYKKAAAAKMGQYKKQYGQNGQYKKAVSLYQRALDIYEHKYGKNHPEVAHVLTDLAAEDDKGRPLLQRAYDIQEQALGADHPDVIAIKEVLGG